MPDTTHTHAASALSHWPCPYWAQLSTRDFALAQASGLAARTVAILPVGATEQHGPHLPLCVDLRLHIMQIVCMYTCFVHRHHLASRANHLVPPRLTSLPT